MHICLFVRATSADDLVDLADQAVRRPLVAAVSAPAAVLEEADPDTIGQLAASDIEWVRSARTAPALNLLPDEFVQSALAVEADQFGDLGLTGASLYFEGPPSTGLPRLAREGDISCAITRTPEARSGVLVDLDMVLPCFGAARGVDLDRPTDDLQLWETGIDQLEERIDAITAMANCDLTTPTRFLEQHFVTGAFTVDDLRAEPDPLLARKLVRIATRLPRRPAVEIVNLILDAASVESLSIDAGMDRHQAVQSALITARWNIDNSRRRADDWSRVSRLDWDADGHEEVQVELKTTSFVIDPRAGGEILVFDDKLSGTTLAWLETEPPGLVFQKHDGDDVPDTVEMVLDGIEESRDGVTLSLADPDGWVRLTIGLSDRALDLEYHLSKSANCRFGPELPLLIGAARLRVDGSEWMEIDQARAVSGHRFRLQGSVREALITSMLPTDLFVRPAPGGVVVWPNWFAAAAGSFPIRIDLRQTSE